MAKVTLKWKGGSAFEPESTQFEDMTPKDFLLYSLGHCAGMTVASFFEKMRCNATGLTIEVEGYQPEDDSEGSDIIFSSILETFRIEGDEAQEAKFVRAVTMTDEKYCRVGALMRRSGTPIDVRILINGKPVKY